MQADYLRSDELNSGIWKWDNETMNHIYNR